MTSPATVRVATWNIRAAIGPGPFPDRWWRRIDRERLHAIGEFITRLDVDVVALQEAAILSRDGELVDNAGDLARQLGLHVLYGATRTFAVADERGDVTGGGTFGNALLSRVPLAEPRVSMLPKATVDAYVEPPDADHPAAGVRYADAPAGLREPRTLLIAELDGLTVASTHFSHIGSAERALQCAATVAAMERAPAALVLADLNARIEADELAPFAGWVDGFAASGIPPGDERRISTDDGFQIDHVLARGATVSRCRVVREAGDLSDHYPVVAEVTIGAHSSPAANR